MIELPRKCMLVGCYNIVAETGIYKAYCEKHKYMERE